ncbi:MAG: hypothetical protein HND58_16535 [Planctomycetota bacterium]|nr:MAG: hypothetical protein HND58_16535 [Planctomycetota bacterium]
MVHISRVVSSLSIVVIAAGCTAAPKALSVSPGHDEPAIARRAEADAVAPLDQTLRRASASASETRVARTVASTHPLTQPSGHPLARPLTRTDLRDFAFRPIGPANMGGRVADLAFAPGNDATFYVGFATGGVFKTTNRGTSLSPIFDDQHTGSIGAIAVADAPESWPGWADDDAIEDRAEAGKGKIVWVGTGEGNNRNSSSWGHGVYRSTDGGGSFEHLGLEATHNIPQLAADPRDPDVCYVAALGPLWNESSDRGLYKTTDGGATWSNVLAIDNTTGCCDVVLDPDNPDTVYAAMYTRIRTAWSYTSGSEQGGIYKSTDGGATWTKLTNGLPNRTSRIGMSIHRSDPRILVAVVASDEGGWGTEPFDNFSRVGGVFRTEDGGETWERVSPLAPRAFYFSRIAIDPVDPDRVYLPGWTVYTSDDGGRTFANATNKKPHVDIHAFEINPDDTDHLLMGTDGGIYQSFDRGSTWQYIDSVAAGQFYNIGVDLSEPYRVAGGLQDNGTWMAPSRTMWNSGPDPFMGTGNVGVTNHDWRFISGGDGFGVAFELGHPEGEHDYFYSESQGGYLGRVDLTTGERRQLRPSPKEGEQAFRFNWNAPFFISPHDHTTLYLGGNHVFKLTQRGERWVKISPDLSTQVVEKITTVGSDAETHGTLVSLAESELAAGLLWAGTDDGRIHLTSTDGGSWTDVTPDTVAGRYISKIEPSRFDRDTVYVAIDGHRSGNYQPTVLMTEDAGATWTDITGDLPAAPAGGCVKVVREDRQNPNVLYCGTERGLFVTLDRGGHWMSLSGGPEGQVDHGPTLPPVPVDDIVQHPRTLDLVVGTHGRSIFILDDASFFGQCTPEVLDADLHAFETQPARPRLEFWYDGFYGDNFFTAPNPAAGAQITYFVKEDHYDGASIKIADSAGNTVLTLSGPGRAGLHRVAWDLQADPKTRIVDPAVGVEFVDPGAYTVKVTIGDDLESETSVEVLPLR